MNIHELSEYQIYKLKSIDPALSSDWRETIKEILPKLNKESQVSVYKNILSKRNITTNLTYIPPDSLKTVLTKSSIKNQELKTIAIQMLKLVESKPEFYDAIELADRVEAILDYINHINIGDQLLDQKNRKNIQNAFLYDLAKWIDYIDLRIEHGVRQLNEDIIKIYFKEVFIKQKIQGRDFRAWDSTDIDFQNQENLPDIIKKEAKNRKFFVIETNQYWFLIGIADKPRQNPYSFKRFLHEETVGNKNFVYLTHVVIRKKLLDQDRYLEHINYCMSRLYTLDSGVSDTISKFIDESHYLYKTYIYSLLKKPLKRDGEDTEYHIYKIINGYEQKLTTLILNKLPGIIQIAIRDKNDQDYLFYYLEKIVNKMIDDIQNFRLRPIAMYSYSAEIMNARLITFKEVLNKIYTLINNTDFDIDNFAKSSKDILEDIREQLKSTEEYLKQIETSEEALKNYSKIKQTGSFWQKLKLGREPNYTLDDIDNSMNEIKKESFLSIIRLAKTHPSNITYLEFECDEVINIHFRHYAIADDKMGVTRLPKILRLPEDHSTFDLKNIDDAINHNAFITNKPFDL